MMVSDEIDDGWRSGDGNNVWYTVMTSSDGAVTGTSASFDNVLKTDKSLTTQAVQQIKLIKENTNDFIL